MTNVHKYPAPEEYMLSGLVTPAERQFLADMRKAREHGVGYGWMQQVTEWEWLHRCDGMGWGPETQQRWLEDAKREIRRLKRLLSREQRRNGRRINV